MNRVQKIEFLRNIETGAIPRGVLNPSDATLDISSNIFIIVGPNKMNNESTIHPELYDLVAKDYMDWGTNPPRRHCYIDSNNVIRDGIKIRSKWTDRKK